MTSSASDDGDALPEPPADIASRRLPLVHRAAGAQYVRIHRAADGPVWFGRDAATKQFRPPTNRFDALIEVTESCTPPAPATGSFAESIGRKPRSFRSDAELAAFAIAVLAVVVEPGASAWLDALLGWWLLTLAWIDLRQWLLPDVLTLPLVVLGLAEAAE